jgi:triacylglycerol esterase/lipase EstA (alpha/beta hydrolase family)
MKRIAIAMLGFALLAGFPLSAIAASGPEAHATGQNARLPAGSIAMDALDPFLVAPKNLGNIGLSAFLAGNPNLPTYAANNIAADGASAAIVLLQTSSLSSVTFTAAGGGVTLLPYSDTFLTKPPAEGSPSLVVSGSSFIHAGAYYYAPVLVQGPLGGYLSTNAITVAATQDTANAQLDLTLVVPPLVLAHGLWGDRGSLSNVEQFIDAMAPWAGQKQLVVPICYSLYLGFDATKDPLSNGKDPCEVTSQASLQTEIDALLAELDSEHTVGGRVDLVAHSMGGLAARNYASQSSYASLRNRMQGQFHTIVTLDTPESGSLLANYLVGHRSSSEKAPFWTFNFYVWEGVCGSADVESCFYANSYPLSALTLPIKTGGVYSLEPNGPSLKNPKLVGPNIAHSTWRAVSATAPGNSALALALNTLIGALYSNPDSAPTLNSILQKLPNDAIVSVPSQTKGAAQFYTFANLSHTSLVSSILTWLSGKNINDNSVVDDPSAKVYQLTACWLATTGSSACKPTEALGNGGSETAQAPLRNVKFVKRINAQAPATAVLGTPVTVAIRLLTPDSVSRLAVYQQGETGRTQLEEVAITRVENRTAYARITPLLLGPVTLGIRAEFGDGAVSVQTTSLYVAPPKFPPALSFKANDLPVLVLTLDGVTREAMPHPLAIYAAPVGRVYLNSRFVTYSLLHPRGTRAIALQPNGSMRALAPGEAMVEAHFGSSVDRLRVIVRATQQ